MKITSLQTSSDLVIESPGEQIFNFTLFLGNELAAPWIIGDLNGDGLLTDDDLDILDSIMGEQSTINTFTADLNGDGWIDEDDYAILHEILDLGTYDWGLGVGGLSNIFIFNHEEENSFSDGEEVITYPFNMAASTYDSNYLNAEFCVYDSEMEYWFCKIARGGGSVSDLTASEINSFINYANQVCNYDYSNSLASFFGLAVDEYGASNMPTHQAEILDVGAVQWFKNTYPSRASICRDLVKFELYSNSYSEDEFSSFDIYSYAFKFQKTDYGTEADFDDLCVVNDARVMIGFQSQGGDQYAQIKTPTLRYYAGSWDFYLGNIVLDPIEIEFDFSGYGNTFLPLGKIG
jgi:hypothetical protein